MIIEAYDIDDELNKNDDEMTDNINGKNDK